ncbi:hypothetical protein U9M48_010682 [Paspalum notatum var. saurae]|uniref:Uncharacterized protein n=1 Tax=Paspalum notatum var. saurae TaxID=547442 RepID=A0AAQ3WGB8_PASNO
MSCEDWSQTFSLFRSTFSTGGFRRRQYVPDHQPLCLCVPAADVFRMQMSTYNSATARRLPSVCPGQLGLRRHWALVVPRWLPTSVDRSGED